LKRKCELLVYRVLAGIFGVLGLIVMALVMVRHPSESAVGERFIVDEFTFSTFFYVFHFKPITLFVIFGFLWWSLGMEGFKDAIERIPLWIKKLIFVFFAVSAFVMGYEVFHNFLLWMSFYIIYRGNLDLLCHQINPAMPKPVNFNFISKLFSMFFAGALYGMYFFHRVTKGLKK